MKKLFNPLFLLIILLLLWLSLSLLLDEPFVWPDEAIYGDIANNLMLENRMGTNLWKGLVDGIENHAYSLPPFYLYTSTLWFKLFSFSITTQRLFSVFLASLSLFVFYTLTQKLITSKNKTYSLIIPLVAVFCLTIDAVFLKTARLARPEILVLLLSLIATFVFIKASENKVPGQQTKLFLLTGLVLGLALITHLIALSFIIAFLISYLYLQRKNLLNIKKHFPIFIGITLPILIWLICLYPNYHYLFDQLNLVSNSRNFTIPWYITVLNFPILMKLNYLFYILITFSFLIFTIKNRQIQNVLLTLILLSSWIFVTLGEIYWYTVYIIPFTYITLFILINRLSVRSKSQFSHPLKLIFIAITIFLIYSNLNNYFSLFTVYGNSNSYSLFQNQILENIPEGKTVYLSSLPDGYYAFESGRNQLIEFPALFSNTDNLEKVLNTIDYIIFNGIFIPDPTGAAFFDSYLAKNTESIKQLSSPYQILIIKLKDKNLRTN